MLHIGVYYSTTFLVQLEKGIELGFFFFFSSFLPFSEVVGQERGDVGITAFIL